MLASANEDAITKAAAMGKGKMLLQLALSLLKEARDTSWPLLDGVTNYSAKPAYLSGDLPCFEELAPALLDFSQGNLLCLRKNLTPLTVA